MNRTNKKGHLEPGDAAAAGKEAMKHEAGKREVEIKRKILKYSRTEAEQKKKKSNAEKIITKSPVDTEPLTTLGLVATHLIRFFSPSGPQEETFQSSSYSSASVLIMKIKSFKMMQVLIKNQMGTLKQWKGLKTKDGNCSF